jgi:hypothetical protein
MKLRDVRQLKKDVVAHMLKSDLVKHKTITMLKSVVFTGTVCGLKEQVRQNVCTR